MEVSEVRRRLRAAIDQARREAAARRERSDRARQDYDGFLAERAVPIFRALALALNGEGHRFQVFTPAGSVRLAAEGSSEDFLELSLDDTQDPPVVILRTSRGRGRRHVETERPLTEGTEIAGFTEDDVLKVVLGEIHPFVER
jgi:hypothetical protein